MPNIFLCLHKGLFTFVVLLAPFFILTRQIQYNYLLVDLESDLIDESCFLSKTGKLLHIEIQVRIFGIFEQVKPIINNSLKNRRIKLLFACSTHCKFGKLSNGFHSCLAVPQAVNGPGVGLLGLLGVGAELLATFECPLCGTE